MLTDEQIKAIDVKTLGYLHFARAIEAETLKVHQQAIEAAVLAERNACAVACDKLYPHSGYHPSLRGAAKQCATVIRARTQNMRIPDAHKEET